MSWIAPDVVRAPFPGIDSPGDVDERTLLEAFLDFYRDTLLVKCAGLTVGQLRSRAVPPSALSLLGLVRHMAEVERDWFRVDLAGEKLAPRWCTREQRDADFDDVDTADPREAFGALAEEVELARSIAAEHTLEDTFATSRGTILSVRWLYLHMIEEYARHCGHADLLRERLDGATGD